MPDAPAFDDLVRRVRAGDHEAAAYLVRNYEAAIRRVVRFRMRDARLGAMLDSLDFCQSVLGSFFVRAAAGQYDLETPEQLVKLLSIMARNKVAGHARKERAQRRDQRRNVAGVDPELVPSDGSSPSQRAITRELLEEVRCRLDPQELRLVELRREGQDWKSIAEALGETPVVLRKRLSRALDRVTGELGLERTSDE
jgi:RNA polymerase sigma-70 factor (ECF subfamily)